MQWLSHIRLVRYDLHDLSIGVICMICYCGNCCSSFHTTFKFQKPVQGTSSRMIWSGMGLVLFHNCMRHLPPYCMVWQGPYMPVLPYGMVWYGVAVVSRLYAKLPPILCGLTKSLCAPPPIWYGLASIIICSNIRFFLISLVRNSIGLNGIEWISATQLRSTNQSSV